MSTTNTDVQEMLATIEPILEAAHTVIDSMQTGTRKQIKELAQDVGAKLGKEAKDVLGFVNHFAHNTKIAYVTRGKNGGIIKGVKPVKVAKAPKKAKVDTTVATDTTAPTV